MHLSLFASILCWPVLGPMHRRSYRHRFRDCFRNHRPARRRHLRHFWSAVKMITNQSNDPTCSCSSFRLRVSWCYCEESCANRNLSLTLVLDCCPAATSTEMLLLLLSWHSNLVVSDFGAENQHRSVHLHRPHAGTCRQLLGSYYLMTTVFYILLLCLSRQHHSHLSFLLVEA